jgi:cell division protein FtsW
MSTLSRLDTSLVGRWWWTVDRWTLIAIALLIAVGAVLGLAAGPAVADKLGLDQYHFSRRQIAILLPAVSLMLGVSLLSPLGIRRLAVIGLTGALLLTAATLFVGGEVKGAQRWLYVGGLSIQPSEFVKPLFAVVIAWMLAERAKGEGFPGGWISLGLLAVVLTLLALQPDVGMAVVVTAVWAGQLFVAGMSMVWIGVCAVLAVAGAIVAYVLFPHVASRIDRFVDPASGDSYQINTALEAFRAGGLAGRGPGEGSVKSVLPDAHTDFIFAVAGEEFGLFACLLIVCLFAFIVLRGLGRVVQDSNLFVMLAAGGLLVQFGLQAVINMGVNLRLMPTKGMTLPFVSYGGSSLLAVALGMGMILALTRRRVGAESDL